MPGNVWSSRVGMKLRTSTSKPYVSELIVCSTASNSDYVCFRDLCGDAPMDLAKLNEP